MLGLNPQWVAGPTEVEVDLKVNSTTSVQYDWFIQQHQNLILPRLSPTYKHSPQVVTLHYRSLHAFYTKCLHQTSIPVFLSVVGI